MIFGSKVSRQKLLPQHGIAEGYLCLGESHPKMSTNSPHLVDLGHNFARTLSNHTYCAFYIPTGHPIHTGVFLVSPGGAVPLHCGSPRKTASSTWLSLAESCSCSLPPPGQVLGQGHSIATLKDLL